MSASTSFAGSTGSARFIRCCAGGVMVLIACGFLSFYGAVLDGYPLAPPPPDFGEGLMKATGLAAIECALLLPLTRAFMLHRWACVLLCVLMVPLTFVLLGGNSDAALSATLACLVLLIAVKDEWPRLKRGW